METALRKTTKLNQIVRKIAKSGRNMHWLMILGCMVPLAAIIILPALGINLGSSVWILFIVLCPLSHLLMMRGMNDHGNREMSGDHISEEVMLNEHRNSAGTQYPLLLREESKNLVELLGVKKDQ